MRDLTLDLNRVEQLGAVGEAETVLHMDEEAFRAFYDRTARQVWAYLSRLSGSPQTADDLLQEAYYRFLRADRVFDSDDHRRNYLFRIATNLVHDGFRRQRMTFVETPDENAANAIRTPGTEGERATRRTGLSRVLSPPEPQG